MITVLDPLPTDDPGELTYDVLGTDAEAEAAAVEAGCAGYTRQPSPGLDPVRAAGRPDVEGRGHLPPLEA
jgi:hypothetical protein